MARLLVVSQGHVGADVPRLRHADRPIAVRRQRTVVAHPFGRYCEGPTPHWPHASMCQPTSRRVGEALSRVVRYPIEGMEAYEDGGPLSERAQARIAQVRQAFAADRFDVDPTRIVTVGDRFGLAAHHRTAVFEDSGEPKTAYYIEGTPFEQGYLLGRLAEPAIAQMTETFIDRVVAAMVREAIHGERLDYTGGRRARLLSIHGLLIDLVHEMIRNQSVLVDVPVAYHEEIRGLVAGCRDTAALDGRASAVSEEELWVLNAGLDCILSRAYSGLLLPARVATRDLQLPIACNAFAVLNDAAADGALFARDYMFPTGGVFQNVACHVICRPAPAADRPTIPWVSMTAPGIVGSITAMNAAGVAAGVDVAVGANCNPHRPGFNSLLLVRRCVESGDHAELAVRSILAAQRGVTWNYMVAASGSGRDRACVVEAGASTDTLPVSAYADEQYRDLLPDDEFLADHRSGEIVRGAMMRWEDFHYPQEYLHYNRILFDRFRRTLVRGAFDSDGSINRRPQERNCPDSFYFAPMRGRKRQVVLTTNHFVIPEMRLCSMHPWANRMFRARVHDSQWRYDELNRRLLGSLDTDGPMTVERAKEVISFLAPDGDFPAYYRRSPRSKDGRRTIIFGSTSVCRLKERTMESRYGYYGDEWIRTELPQYVEA